MTSVAPLEVPLPVVAELEAPPLALVVELLDEQAASPAARRPVAASASALLLNLGLVVNFDCPLGLNSPL